MKTWELIVLVICLAFCWLVLCNPAHASNPDLVPYDYGVDDPQAVGGSKWTTGDTFVLVGVAIGVAGCFLLPRIFDGKYEWPVNKFKEYFTNDKTCKQNFKFPTNHRPGLFAVGL